MADQRCNHEGCNCTVRADARRDGFCSDACKEGREESGRCECGHANCE